METPRGVSLWGADAVRELRLPRVLDAAVPAEDALLRRLRACVGPYADERRLRHHLRSSHGKLAWAVNGYLREAVLQREARADFEPGGGPPRACGIERTVTTELPTDHPPALLLPLALWEHILHFLDAQDVHSASGACAQLRSAGERQWRPLFERRWGVLAAREPLPCWRAAYAARTAALLSMSCPCCSLPQALVVRAPLPSLRPVLTLRAQCVVYGFPSPPLVAEQRAGRVRLGGDYLLDADPLWACIACEARWAAWPWAVGGVPPLLPSPAGLPCETVRHNGIQQ